MTEAALIYADKPETHYDPDWYQGFDENEILLEYQRKWIADDAQIKICEKTRRGGVTWAEAADATLCAGAARSAGGCNHFYVGSNKEMAREFIDAVAMWARAFDQAAGEIHEEIFNDKDGEGDKDILTFVVYFASGFKVQALSSNPSNLRGMQGNVTIDEAAFHEKLAELLKAALALTMWGSKVRIISTHNGFENLFNELIQDCRAGKKRYSVHRITLDDACRQGLYKRICQVTGQTWSIEAEQQWKANLLSDTATKEDAEEEYYCVAKQGGGAYLSRALIESRMVPAPVLLYECSAEFNALPEPVRRAEVNDWCNDHLIPLLKQLNKDALHGFGEDFGRSGDLTVLAPIVLKQNLLREIPFLIELRNMPYKQQEQILFVITGRLPRFIGGALDARGNGEYLAEQAHDKYGDIIQCVKLTQGWYLENMPKMKAGFEDAEITIPKDTDVLNDLRAIQVIKGIPKIPDGDTNKGKKGQRHGDAAIAIAMAWFATTMNTSPIEFTPLPEKASRWDGIDDGDNDMPSFEAGAW